jgi:hypothetical protein
MVTIAGQFPAAGYQTTLKSSCKEGCVVKDLQRDKVQLPGSKQLVRDGRGQKDSAAVLSAHHPPWGMATISEVAVGSCSTKCGQRGLHQQRLPGTTSLWNWVSCVLGREGKTETDRPKPMASSHTSAEIQGFFP